MNTRPFRKHAIALALAIAAITAAASAAESSHAVFPPNPLVYAAIRDGKGLGKDFAATPLSEMLAEPALEPVKQAWAGARADIRQAINLAGPQAERQAADVATVLGMLRRVADDTQNLDAALYLHLDEARRNPSGHVCVKVQLRGKTLDLLRKTVFTEGVLDEPLPPGWKLLDERTQAALDRGALKLEELPNGAILRKDEKPDKPVAVLSGDTALLSTDAQWAIDTAEGKIADDAIDPAAEALGDDPSQPAIVFGEDLRPVWRLLEQAEKELKKAAESGNGAESRASARAAEELPKVRMVRELAKQIGYESLTSMWVRHTMGADGFRTRAEIGFQPGGPRGLLDMGGNRPFQIGQWALPRLVSAAELNTRPVGEIWGQVRDTVQAIGGIAWTNALDSLIDRVQRMTGINVETDILKNLSGHFICCAAADPKPVPMQLPPMFLGAEVLDGPTAIRVADCIAGLLPPGLAISTEEKQAEGAAYKTVSAAVFPFVQPAYGTIGDMFVLASSGPAFEEIARTHAAGGSPESKEAIDAALKRAGLPTEGLRLNYSDPIQSLRQAQKAITAIGPYVPIAIMAASKNARNPREAEIARTLAVSVSNLVMAIAKVDPAPLAAHLFPRIGVAQREGDKVVWDEQTSMDEDMMAAAAVTGALTAAVISGHRQKEALVQRERAKREAESTPRPSERPE